MVSLITRRGFLGHTAAAVAATAVVGGATSSALADPMLSLIKQYRMVDPVYGRMCLAEDDDAADAFYEAHVAPIRHQIAMKSPPVTTEAGARECIRAVLEEQCILDDFPHSLLKSALAFLDGRAV